MSRQQTNSFSAHGERLQSNNVSRSWLAPAWMSAKQSSAFEPQGSLEPKRRRNLDRAVTCKSRIPYYNCLQKSRCSLNSCFPPWAPTKHQNIDPTSSTGGLQTTKMRRKALLDSSLIVEPCPRLLFVALVTRLPCHSCYHGVPDSQGRRVPALALTIN